MNKAAITLLCFGKQAAYEEETNIGDYIMAGREKLFGFSVNLAQAFQDDACYQCGHCCREMPCRYSVWDKQKNSCVYLTVAEQTRDYTTYACAKYAQICEKEEENKYRMFGGGCYRPLYNHDRDQVRLHKLHR